MRKVTCPGLPANWVNGWLASVGITVLDPRLRLHWSPDTIPVAVISAESADPVDILVSAWPSGAMLADFPVAETWSSESPSDEVSLPRKVSVEALRARMRAARQHLYSWTLTSTLTDLCVDEKGKAGHARFDPAGTGPMGCLHDRLTKAHAHIDFDSRRDRIQSSLEGRGRRVAHNGLGFDQTRIGSQSDKQPGNKNKWTDPVVEVLTFFGLALLPVRGPGVDRRLSPSAELSVRQRGWQKSKKSGQCFFWPAWKQPLGRAGIDALLDAWSPEMPRTWDRYGIHAAWMSVQYMHSDRDMTRAYGARRL
ncbi:MAG: hypothetical protein OXF88_00155 [Rhodobacteraceae bacterium]|nr:hypothetical protein [Paracoccaceae bacterium]